MVIKNFITKKEAQQNCKIFDSLGKNLELINNLIQYYSNVGSNSFVHYIKFSERGLKKKIIKELKKMDYKTCSFLSGDSIIISW